MSRRTVKVEYLARVEGEGSLDIEIENDQVKKAYLKIFEPPRFFEAFLRGRSYREAPDITARICGICPVAYQMSAVHAIEQAFGFQVEEPLRSLRRLLYCGEWIESHILHMFMLHAPDFLHYPDAIQMSKQHPELVATALRIKKLGNDIVGLLGGRAIHPINVKVGGFYSVPEKPEFLKLLPEIASARTELEKAIQWAATLDYPDFERNYIAISVYHPNEYPFNEGVIKSSQGWTLPFNEYESKFVESHVERSSALHSHLTTGEAYLTGPLARFANGFDQLPPSVRDLATDLGLTPQCRNPFKTLLIRGLETLFALEEAESIIQGLPNQPSAEQPVKPRAGEGFWCTEAPRGLLYHHYEIDDDGKIVTAKIVPPTSQNQRTIEEDLEDILPSLLKESDEVLQHRCEQAIRNYDPCISCSTHFLKVRVNGRELAK